MTRHRFVLGLLGLVLAALPARAMVATPPDDGTAARHAVLLVGSRGNFCTGTAIARDLVLTAAHCVLPGADYKLVQFDAARQPALKDVVQVVRHPQFDMNALNRHRATADVALVKLAAPLPSSFAPAHLVGARGPLAVGEHFVVSGFGVAVRGDGKTGGTLRTAQLTATGRPGTLQLRLVDPKGNNTRPGAGACTGDSGAPVFAASDFALTGVVSWSTGPNGSAGCGGLTGVTPLMRYRDWIVDTARALGSPVP